MPIFSSKSGSNRRIPDDPINPLYNPSAFRYRLAMIKTIDCFLLLQGTVNQLVADGADPASIIAALTEVTVITAQRNNEHAVLYLEGSSLVLSTAAQSLK
jgi:hypothetical protein